jgi:hypothetical protein
LAADITKNGYTLIIVGTAGDIVDALVAEHYPRPVGINYNSSDGLYRVIAYRL